MSRKGFHSIAGFSGFARARGVTLVELLVSLVIGLLLVAFVGSAYLVQNASGRTMDESARLQETARIAINVLERVIRHAGFVEYGQGQAPQNFCGTGATTTDDSAGAPPIQGPFIEGRSGGGHFANSDRLILRFYGSGAATQADGDGAIRDCRGVSVPGQAVGSNAVNWFFVANDADGEPALFCGVKGPGIVGQAVQALIPGVESFQVLFLEAPAGSNAPRRLLSANEVTDWRRIVAVRLSLMIRGDVGSRSDLDTGPSPAQTYYDMFDPHYTVYATADAGRTFDPNFLSDSQRRRLRRAFTTTIELRNSTAAVCT
ncbi:MAG: PilW family protein [Casimicrobiaceae bacterium]|nr:PilW family protein [Casimicrobiaceae bacterium]MCX8098003.1 PilW family protein [Casimicrobiaceae bacterium]MDW8311702.1 PilW family protein [Burkholderiales bacterium]